MRRLRVARVVESRDKGLWTRESAPGRHSIQHKTHTVDMCVCTICSQPLCATLAKETESAARLAAKLTFKTQNASDDDLTMSEITELTVSL